MNNDEKSHAKFQWIKDDDGKHRRTVTRATANDAGKALENPENVPTRAVDTSFDVDIPPDWQALQNARSEDDDIYVLKRRKEDMVFDDALLPRLAPMVAEGVIWRLYQLKCWEPGPADKAALASDLWPFHVTCALIAAQFNEGALNNIAAHRRWEGRTIRDGRRPDQVMSFAEAVEALRLGLEAGRLHARRSSAPGAEIIPAKEWSVLKWELSKYGELLEFDQLRYDGELLYRRPVLLRDDVIGLIWTARGPVMPPSTKTIHDKSKGKAPGVAEAAVVKAAEGPKPIVNAAHGELTPDDLIHYMKNLREYPPILRSEICSQAKKDFPGRGLTDRVIKQAFDEHYEHKLDVGESLRNRASRKAIK